jgi:hypothetical protein
MMHLNKICMNLNFNDVISLMNDWQSETQLAKIYDSFKVAMNEEIDVLGVGRRMQKF